MANDSRRSEGAEDAKEAAVDWDLLVSRVSVVANPLASKKLAKKLFKVIRKAQKRKQLRKGVREVQKFIRKGERGLAVFAGDTNPVDVIAHMPVVCEEKDIPYCYVPSKEGLGGACGSHRQTCAVMIKSHEDYKDLYDSLYADVKSLPLPL